MKYRSLGRTGLSVSEIGMGCEGLLEKPYETVLAYVDEMEKLGVNIIDLYAPNPEFRENLGRALQGRRERFLLQAHLCSIWKDGQYKRSRDIDEVREHYAALPHKAGECIQCGACESRCPFEVSIRENMRKAADMFGA